MNKCRITFENESGTRYSYLEDDPDYLSLLEIGTWLYPFSKTDCAFGLVESLTQSDGCPRAFYEEEITKVSVETVGE